MDKKLKRLKKVFPEQLTSRYQDIDLNSLIAYVCHVLSANSIPLTFENIYVGAYLSFPNKFCLVDFPEYPDGARINRSILQCSPKYQNILVGKAKKGYKLTEFGIARAKDVVNLLKKDHAPSKYIDNDISKRTVDFKDKFTKLKQKPAFYKFRKDQVDDIQADEIFDFLDSSPFEHKKKIQEKLRKLESIAEYSKSKSLLEFIRWIRKNKNFRKYLEM